MGSLLAQAGAPNKRFMLPNARHMIHQPSGGAGGQATDMEIQVKEILKMKKTLTQIYADHNSKGITFDQLTKDMERDNFMSADEALQYGLIDSIVAKRSDVQRVRHNGLHYYRLFCMYGYSNFIHTIFK